MFVEVAVVDASVTKTIRKVSPALSPVGVVIVMSATARPPAPNTSQSIAAASAHRPILVNIMDLLYVGCFGQPVTPNIGLLLPAPRMSGGRGATEGKNTWC